MGGHPYGGCGNRRTLLKSEPTDSDNTGMNKSHLLALLADVPDDAEIRIYANPASPMQHDVAGVTTDHACRVAFWHGDADAAKTTNEDHVAIIIGKALGPAHPIAFDPTKTVARTTFGMLSQASEGQ